MLHRHVKTREADGVRAETLEPPAHCGSGSGHLNQWSPCFDQRGEGFRKDRTPFVVERLEVEGQRHEGLMSVLQPRVQQLGGDDRLDGIGNGVSAPRGASKRSDLFLVLGRRITGATPQKVEYRRQGF